MNIINILINLCCNEIFPSIDNTDAKVTNILLYGSRATNMHHENSDIDATIVVESNSKIDLEFHGRRSGIDIDLKIQDQSSVMYGISNGDFAQALNLSCSIDLMSENDFHIKVKNSSSSWVNLKIEEKKKDIKGINYECLFGLLEHQMYNYNVYFNSSRKASTIVYNGKMFEAVSDYLKGFIRLHCYKNNEYETDVVKLLACLDSFERNSCYMEVLRYDFFPLVTGLVNNIEQWSWDSVRKNIEEFHFVQFGTPLFQPNSYPQDILVFNS